MSAVAIEACISCDDPILTKRSVANAYSGGADRVELCADITNGGTTPSIDAIQIAREAFHDRKGVLVMIRPRTGNFDYSSDEVNAMCRQIEMAADAGADGIVLGALKNGSIDTRSLEKLISLANGRALATTFHRAFDAVSDRLEALEVLITTGIDRILTSGTPWLSGSGAVDGLDMLQLLIERVDGRAEIVVGGGVGLDNVGKILKRLAGNEGPISLHAFSALIRNGETNAELVSRFSNQVNNR